MSSLTVYSCITGNIKDSLETLLNSQPDAESSQDVRFVLFTDRMSPAIYSGPGVSWEIRKPLWTHVNSRRTSRYHKLNAHLAIPDTECSLWYDGAMELKPGTNLRQLVNHYLADVDLATFKHPERTCIYQELEACIRFRKDDPAIMRQQVERYRREGYPPFNGLVETGCVCRRHTPEVQAFNEAWWHELSNNSLRDQLSFNYVVWRQQFKFGYMDGRRDTSPYFYFHSHK